MFKRFLRMFKRADERVLRVEVTFTEKGEERKSFGTLTRGEIFRFVSDDEDLKGLVFHFDGVRTHFVPDKE